jgi:hypothetical protein
MKFWCLLSILFVFAIVLPAVAQTPAQPPAQAPANAAHETVIDGRWEAKETAGGTAQVTLFEFKNATGTVSGTVTQDGKPTEIKNGTLDGVKLSFETHQIASGGAEPVTLTWEGTIVSGGDAIKLTRATTDDRARGRLQELQATRVK